MKIIYIANIRMPTEKAHGAQIMKMCEALERAGVEVTLAVTNRKTDIRDDPFSYYDIRTKFAIQRLPVMDLVGFGRVGFWLELISFTLSCLWFLRRERADFIFCRDEGVLWAAAMLGYTNIIWESHDGRYNGMIRKVLATCPVLFVTSHAAKELYVSHGTDAKKIVVVPNGIDLEEFFRAPGKGAARKELGFAAGDKIALYVGRLDGWKGIETFLEASVILSPQIRTVIIGGESAQVERLRLRYPSAIFLGFRPYRQLAQNLASADVLVLPNTAKEDISVRFTSPLKLFAYMASSVPIVASDLPSIREVLSEKNAVLVSPDDPEALAHAIESLLKDVGQSNKLAAQARQDVQKYTWENRARTIQEAISEHI